MGQQGGPDNGELRYTVLLYEEYGHGVWAKIPEFDIQCAGETAEVALDHVCEALYEELRFREMKGEDIPERLVRTTRYVDKDGYGPTQLELEEERVQRELEEEYGADEEDGIVPE